MESNTMRRATKLKLLLEVLFIASFHVGVLFTVYGRRLLPTLNEWSTVVWLLLPSCGAFSLYYFSLSKADLFGGPFRRGKLAMSSVGATLFSLYWGVFFALNTYGS